MADAYIDYANSERTLQNILKSLQSCADPNSKLITDFIKEKLAGGVSYKRAISFANALIPLKKWADKPFQEFKKEDVIRCLAKLRSSGLADLTQYSFAVAWRQFFRWLGKEDIAEIIKPKRRGKSLPKGLPSEEEIRKIIETCDIKYKAFFSLLYESGMRVGEAICLRVGDVSFDAFGARIQITQSKTKQRIVRVVQCVPFLQAWLNKHKWKEDKEAPLFYAERRTRGARFLKYNSVDLSLKRACARAGIRRRITLHAFRHARATQLAKRLTEQELKRYFGWSNASQMAAVYVHLSGQDIEDALLSKVYGIKQGEEKKEQDIALSKRCPRCGTQNPFTNKFCEKCGCGLDVETILQQEGNLEVFIKGVLKAMLDKEIRKLIKQSIREELRARNAG